MKVSLSGALAKGPRGVSGKPAAVVAAARSDGGPPVLERPAADGRERLHGTEGERLSGCRRGDADAMLGSNSDRATR